MPFLALLGNPLVRYSAAVVGILLAVWGFYGWAEHRGALNERGIWQKKMDEQKADAARLIAEKTAAIAAEESRTAALNNQLEENTANARREIETARNDFDRRLAQRVREQGSRLSCPNPGKPQADSPGGGENVAGTSLNVPEQAVRDIATLAKEADELVAVMAACKSWAVEHGR